MCFRHVLPLINDTKALLKQPKIINLVDFKVLLLKAQTMVALNTWTHEEKVNPKCIHAVGCLWVDVFFFVREAFWFFRHFRNKTMKKPRKYQMNNIECFSICTEVTNIRVFFFLFGSLEVNLHILFSMCVCVYFSFLLESAEFLPCSIVSFHIAKEGIF